MTTAPILLSATGGLCELVGLALVVIEIKDDRERAKRVFQRRPRRQRPRRRYPGRTLPPLNPTFTHPMSPAAEQQRAMARAIGRLTADTYNVLVDMRKDLDAQLDKSVETLEKEIADADDELRGHLLYVLAGSVPKRIAGAVLLGAGIVLGTAGTIVGTLST